ncbi:hypothetical protein [Burkholderia sp. AU32262]|uniref:hypothetical protein n=1 Tax=Burkholderia sp. AU32262 TaxID=2879630 RepID=UPI001CF38755|nr:hypothetical protein [Burkholderia sp. AU32262]MCA8240613.1 hypothetical protein [Burkholderia sp. AU32262]
MEFSSGEDELGQFDECVITVDGDPFIFQQYVNPPRGGFAVELPRSLLDDTPKVSRKLSALLAHLGVESEDLVWRHAGVELQFPVQDKTEPPSVAEGATESQLRGAAARAVRFAQGNWTQHLFEPPDWVDLYSRANEVTRPLLYPSNPTETRPWLMEVDRYRMALDLYRTHLRRRSGDVSVWAAVHEMMHRAQNVQHDPAFVTFLVHEGDDDEDEPTTEKAAAAPAKRTRTPRRGGKSAKRAG